jgi:cathepsin L
MQKRFEEWMTRYHCTFKEEDMKNRFEKWMAKYNRTYKDEVEKAWRYQLFKECAKRVDRLNALPDGVTYKTNHFCDLSDEEMSLYTGGELV